MVVTKNDLIKMPNNSSIRRGRRRSLENILHDRLFQAIAAVVASQEVLFGEDVNDVTQESEYRAEDVLQELENRTEDYIQHAQYADTATVVVVVITPSAICPGVGEGGGLGLGLGDRP